jgi:hypothetical protein
MNMQGDHGELMKEGRREGANERRRLGLMSSFVTKDGREFDLKYRFEDKYGDCGGHGVRQDHF